MTMIGIAVGGFLGSMLRYALNEFLPRGHRFPLGTLFVNLTGAVLLGFLHGLALPRELLFFLGDGFLGAYTTFSTFMYGGVRLIKGGEKKNAILYVTGTAILGIGGCALAYFVARNLIA